jgi:uncharacterized protein (TIGR03086 family)
MAAPLRSRPADDGRVALLERSLGYTRTVLAPVGAAHLGRPTPCAGWDLARLLAHMDDALAAFLEASAGDVDLVPAAAADDPVESVRRKACALLGTWLDSPPPRVVLVDAALSPATLLGAAALEIAVHGWDVAQATGARTPLPPALAWDLLPVARDLVQPADRVTRFGPDLTVIRSEGAPTRPAEVLLAFLGRMSGPPGGNPGIPPTPGPRSS